MAPGGTTSLGQALHPLVVLLGPGLPTHLVILTLIRSSTICRVSSVTLTFSSPICLEGAPSCGDRGTIRWHGGIGWRGFEGFQSSGFGAGPWRSPPGRKETQECDWLEGREGEKSELPVAGQRKGADAEVGRGEVQVQSVPDHVAGVLGFILQARVLHGNWKRGVPPSTVRVQVQSRDPSFRITGVPVKMQIPGPSQAFGIRGGMWEPARETSSLGDSDAYLCLRPLSSKAHGWP